MLTVFLVLLGVLVICGLIYVGACVWLTFQFLKLLYAICAILVGKTNNKKYRV